MLYKCAECGSAVLVEDENVTRVCDHENAGIIAPAEATLYGSGGLMA